MSMCRSMSVRLLLSLHECPSLTHQSVDQQRSQYEACRVKGRGTVCFVWLCLASVQNASRGHEIVPKTIGTARI